MLRKKTIAALLFVLFCLSVSMCPAKAEEAQGEKVTDYKQISALIADTWEADYFEEMVITPASDTMEKDGEKEKVSEEFSVSRSEAKKITKSERTLEEYLKEQEGVYEVERKSDGTLSVEAPYQTKRLIVESASVADSYGAEKVYCNTEDAETILQYETEEETESAYEKLRAIYGEADCYPDEVVSVDAAAMALEEDSEAGTLQAASDGKADTYSWGASYMGLDALKGSAANVGYTRKVTVAVIDTGINRSNTLFQGRTILSASYNFFDNNSNVTDVYGHGTHVAGIIADATPANVQFLILRVTNKEGLSSLLTIKLALQYAVSQDADVMNLSMGFIDEQAESYNYLDSIIDKAYERGIPLCTAAGNGWTGKGPGVDVRYCYPACSDKTITVSAIDVDGVRGSYANYGSGIDFCAPGTSITSADWKGTTKVMSGTSMATPHITAAIAYLKMMQPSLSVQGVYKELRAYAKDLGASGKDVSYGWGCPVLTNLFSRGIIYRKYITILHPSITLANTTRGVKVSWERTLGAAKYLVYRKKKGGIWKKIKTVSTTSWTDKKAKNGEKYSYRVRAYNDGIYGRYSTAKTTYCLRNRLSNVRVRRKSARKVQVSWRRMRGATKYQVEYARNKNFKNSRKVSASSKRGSLTTRKLSKRKYYFRVRYLYRKGSVKVWSPWSRTMRLNVY